MKLCLFQGTFNPIHNAHLKVCEYAKKQFKFDKILVIPAANPPHKTLDRDLAYHRLQMAELAVQDKEYLEARDVKGQPLETFIRLMLIPSYKIHGFNISDPYDDDFKLGPYRMDNYLIHKLGGNDDAEG